MRFEQTRMLVVLASHGTRNLHMLQEVIERYHKMPFPVDVKVVSDAPKDLGPRVEVVVGRPTRNPWSLPFAHKRLLAENVDRYDLFAYSEDDMVVTDRNVRAFVEVSKKLPPDEIAGFLRYEVDAAGNWSLPELHDRHHWIVRSTQKRADLVVAAFSCDHAAFYMLTRRQLQAAIASGQYLCEPYEDRYDMLCTAATDPYTRCGMRKVICISALDDFLIHHKSNRYAGRFGVSLAEARAQVATLLNIANGEQRAMELCATETRMRHGEWSKSYYEPPLPEVLDLVPTEARTVLSIGCGWGALESRLRERGADVTVLPMDSVAGAAAERCGFNVVYASLDDGFELIGGCSFDCIVISNLLHLLPDTDRTVAQCIRQLRKGGSVVLTGPNFQSARITAKRLLNVNGYGRLRSYADSGVRMIGPVSLARQLRKAGLDQLAVRWSSPPSTTWMARWAGVWAASHWTLRASA